MNKGLELPIAVYGILKAGAAYVPIDPAAPLSRVRFIIDDCGLRHLVTNASRERRTAELAADVATLRSVIGARAAAGETSCRFLSWEALEGAGTHPPQVR